MRGRTAVKLATRIDTRWVLGLATLVLLLGSAMASAAGYTTNCGKPTAELIAASAEDRDLSLSVVDLTDEAVADLPEIDAVDAGGDAAADTSTPMLYLGPRVESIARDVFGDLEQSGRINGGINDTASPISSLAQSEDEKQKRDAEKIQSAPLDDRPYSPLRVHREMYRTDI